MPELEEVFQSLASTEVCLEEEAVIDYLVFIPTVYSFALEFVRSNVDFERHNFGYRFPFRVPTRK